MCIAARFSVPMPPFRSGPCDARSRLHRLAGQTPPSGVKVVRPLLLLNCQRIDDSDRDVGPSGVIRGAIRRGVPRYGAGTGGYDETAGSTSTAGLNQPAPGRTTQIAGQLRQQLPAIAPVVPVQRHIDRLAVRYIPQRPAA